MGMTREEAKSCICTIKMLQRLAYNIHGVMDVIDADNCKKIIKALEQEPCRDAVSREKAKQFLYERLDRLNDDELYDIFSRIIDDMYNKLPSVIPQPKMGKWIKKYAEDGCGERYSYWACSECGRDVGFNLANIEDVLSEYPYCHCGAKMVEPQERSDKE